ncbi:MAG: hypothetical protein M0R75_15320 [Dehalococcoidia bacterium]|nr:hypothetical protein [Dehalococcoidia bacterium]
MPKSLAWGYGLAGAVVAVAVIAVAATTVGLTEGADGPEPAPTFSTGTLPGALGEGVVASEVVTTVSGEQVEYVYVDQPATGDHDHDDDDEHEHEHDDDDHDDDHEDDD